METQESTIYRLAMRRGGQGIYVQISNFWSFLEQGVDPEGHRESLLNHLLQIFSSIIILNKSPRGTRLTLLYIIAHE